MTYVDRMNELLSRLGFTKVLDASLEDLVLEKVEKCVETTSYATCSCEVDITVPLADVRPDVNQAMFIMVEYITDYIPKDGNIPTCYILVEVVGETETTVTTISKYESNVCEWYG